MDAELRNWARTAASDVEAEARHLRKRVQSGELSKDRLELAAYCSYSPAVIAHGSVGPLAPTGEWLKGLFPWGKEAAVRAALAIALEVTKALAKVEPSVRGLEERDLGPVLSWVQHPTEASRRAVQRQLKRQPRAFAVGHALRAAARVDESPLQRAQAAMKAAEDAAKAFNSTFHGGLPGKVSFQIDHQANPERESALRSALPSRQELRACVQEALTLWALSEAE